MIKRILLYFALLFSFVVPTMAQPTFLIANQEVSPDQQIEVEVKVEDFQEIMSMQFSYHWDASVLKLDSVGKCGALRNYTKANFGLKFAEQGKLATAWFDEKLESITLEDQTSILTLYFTVIGTMGSSTDVKITGNPTAIEISEVNGSVLQANFQTGTITVNSPLRTTDLSVQTNDHFTLYQNEPNPFNHQTLIRFDLHAAQQVQLIIYDLDGKMVYSHLEDYVPGAQVIEVKNSQLPKTGAYLYTLKTNEYSLTNKMVFIR